MCYAYRDSASEEPLLEHLEKVAEFCRNRWEFSALAKKISKMLNLDENSVRNVLTLALLLHDIGKAAYIYQERCSSGCKDFRGHHLLSVFLIHLTYNSMGIRITFEDLGKFLEDRFDKLEKDKIIAMLVLLPIIFHHYHQVGGFKSYYISEYRNVEKFIDNPMMWRECLDDLMYLSKIDKQLTPFIEELYGILLNINGYRDSDLYRASKLFIENFGKEVVEEDVKKLTTPLPTISLAKFIIEAILGLVNLCDGSIAYEARRKLGKGKW